MGSNQENRCGSEFAKWYGRIDTPEECADEWRQYNADFKVLGHEWFHRVPHHVYDGLCTGEFATVIWRLDSFTVSFRGDVRGESGLRELSSVNRRTPQWEHGRFTKSIMQPGSKNGVIQNSDTCNNFVVPCNYDVFPLLMMQKHPKWTNYGHVAYLQELLCQPGSKNSLI